MSLPTMEVDSTFTSKVSSIISIASSDKNGLAIAPLSLAAMIFPSAVY